MKNSQIESFIKKGITAIIFMIIPCYVFASGGHGEGEALSFIWKVTLGMLIIEFFVLLFLYRELLMSINVILVSIFSTFILLYLSSMIIRDASFNLMIWIFGPLILMIIMPIGISLLYKRYIKPILENNIIIKLVNYVVLLSLIISLGYRLIFVN